MLLTSAIFAKAATPEYSIDTEKKTVVYENGFDSPDALSSFAQYNGKFAVQNGRAVLQSYSKSTNAFMLYNGSDPALTSLTDYIVEVDLYNVQTAAGLVAFCDKQNAKELIHGYAGYNIFTNSTGTKLALRSSSEDGKSTPYLKVSSWRINPGDNIHITAAVMGDIIQVSFRDIDDGREIWAFSVQNTEHRGSSFGLMAYTKIYDGVLDCRKSSFDNLRVSLISDSVDMPSMSTVTGSFDLKSYAKATAASALATWDGISQKAGTASVKTFLPESGRAGLVFGYGADGSHYRLGISSDKKLHLMKVTAQKSITLKTTSLSAMGAGAFGACELRAVFDSGRIYCYINDMCLLCYTDGTYLSGGGIGIFSDNAGQVLLDLKASEVTEPDRADIVIWGHSHMQGWYDAKEDLSSYGKVANLGVGGSNTTYWSNLTEELSTYQADIMVVMTGSNDMGSNTAKGIATTIKNTFKKLKAKNPDLHFVLITEWFQPSRLEQYESKVREMEVEWRALADSDPESITIVDGFSIPLDKDGNFSDAIFTDTQHFGILGYRELRARVCEAIDNVLAGNFTGGGTPSPSDKNEESTDTKSEDTKKAEASEPFSDTSENAPDTSASMNDSLSATEAAIICISSAVIVACIVICIILLKDPKKK